MAGLVLAVRWSSGLKRGLDCLGGQTSRHCRNGNGGEECDPPFGATIPRRTATTRIAFFWWWWWWYRSSSDHDKGAFVFLDYLWLKRSGSRRLFDQEKNKTRSDEKRERLSTKKMPMCQRNVTTTTTTTMMMRTLVSFRLVPNSGTTGNIPPARAVNESRVNSGPTPSH